MSYWDIIIVIVVLWAAYKGFRKGFVLSIFSLLALFAGIYASIHLSEYVGDALNDHMNIDKQWLHIIALAVTFIATVIAVHFLGKAIEKLVHLVALKTINKLFGMLFSVLKSILIMSVVFVLMEAINQKIDVLPAQPRKDALLYYPIHDLTGQMMPFLQDQSLWQQIRDEFD